MMKRRYAGRHLFTLGAILLLTWAGYELYARLDTIWWALSGLWRMCSNENIPFRRALSYFDPSMFRLVLFLFCCVVYALFCIALRNRPRGAYLILLLGVALAWFGLDYLGLLGSGRLELLKLIPLLMIAAGCLINLIQFYFGRYDERGSRMRHRRRPRFDDAEEDDEDDGDDIIDDDDDSDDDDSDEDDRRRHRQRDRRRYRDDGDGDDDDARYIRLDPH